MTNHRTISPIRITIIPKLKIFIDLKKKVLAGRPFKITKNTKSNVLMCLTRLMHSAYFY